MLVNWIGDSCSSEADPSDMSRCMTSALVFPMRSLQSSASCTITSWPFAASAKIGSARQALASL